MSSGFIVEYIMLLMCSDVAVFVIWVYSFEPSVDKNVLFVKCNVVSDWKKIFKTFVCC